MRSGPTPGPLSSYLLFEGDGRAIVIRTHGRSFDINFIIVNASKENAMQETTQQYTERILSYSADKDEVAVQQATPGKLAALIEGKSQQSLTGRPAPDTWSVAEILAHLADAEVATSWRLRQILSTNGVPIQAFDQNAWAATFDYAQRDPHQSLETFRVLRHNNIALLKSVPRERWNNYGMHQERGKETVTQIVRLIAGHDLNHLKQIENILAKNK